jgi:hypothetical protein
MGGPRQHSSKAAVGDPDFLTMVRCEKEDVEPFRFYRVDLPSSYHHGLPPTWLFAVLSQGDKARTQAEVKAATLAGHDIVGRRMAAEEPLIIVSEDPRVHLADNLPPNCPTVFYLDAPELVKKPRRPIRPHLAPFIMALRKQLSSREVERYLHFFCPLISVTNLHWDGNSSEEEERSISLSIALRIS